MSTLTWKHQTRRAPAIVHWPERWRVDSVNGLTGERIETVGWFVTEYQARAYVRAVATDHLNWKFEFSMTVETWERVK